MPPRTASGGAPASAAEEAPADAAEEAADAGGRVAAEPAPPIATRRPCRRRRAVPPASVPVAARGRRDDARRSPPDTEPWGRVDEDGTVSVREADGWRVVGPVPRRDRRRGARVLPAQVLRPRERGRPARGASPPGRRVGRPICARPRARCTPSSRARPPSATWPRSTRACSRSPARSPRHPRPKRRRRGRPSTRPCARAPSSWRRPRRSPRATRAACSGSRPRPS